MNNVDNTKINRKYKIDIKKFGIFLFIIIIVTLLIIIIVSNKSINEDTDLSKLNSKKYSEELLQKYNATNMKSIFLQDYETIQTAVAVYILNNSTMDSDSFSKIYENINSELKKNRWDSLEIEKNKTWNGTWSINENGALKFKFSAKQIEPNWINDADIIGKIEVN